jgi:hypothetical protein
MIPNASFQEVEVHKYNFVSLLDSWWKLDQNLISELCQTVEDAFLLLDIYLYRSWQNTKFDK